MNHATLCVNITHSCGHVTANFRYDCLTAYLIDRLRHQPCLACKLQVEIMRACHHIEPIPRRLMMTDQELEAERRRLCTPCHQAHLVALRGFASDATATEVQS
ncbi:MAG: hypothetical protein H0W02_10280 [Ktedonobacteraceae bacterium]|nr:hypothetical protein [Ktedonobacteraceae bacterium]